MPENSVSKNELAPIKQPRLVYSPHPISAAANRQIISFPFLPDESIEDYLLRVGIEFNTPVILQLNDRRIDVEQWSSVVPKSGDLITIRALVQGGGEGGSDPLRIILTIGVLALSQGTLAGWVGFMTGTSAAVGTAVVAIGGLLLVNALVPIPEPPDFGDNTSPTYSITNGANRARLFQPLSLVMGTHKVVADLGVKPYTEIRGEDQYLFQVFHFGLSDLILSNYQIGDTPITSFEDVVIEESLEAQGGKLNLFPANVDTVPGGTLELDNTWVQRTTSINTTSIGIDINGLIFYTGKKGFQALRVTLLFEYRLVGSSTWLNLTTWIIANDTRTPYRIGLKFDVPEGQYEVRGQYVDATLPGTSCEYDVDQERICTTVYNPVDPDTNTNASAVITWSGLRSYQPDTATYRDQKRVAVSIKASGQLQGQIEQFNAIASAQCPVWNGSAWVTQETSNPAWWFLWFARGKFRNGVRLFGAGLPDSRIDIAAIQAWAVWCDAKGLTFNAVIDRTMNCQQVLQLIARAGRAAPTWATGTLGAVWDAENQGPITMFGMGNIVRSSFQVSYLTGRVADEVVVNFINPNNAWQPDTVRSPVPGVTNPQNPVTIDLFGCTSEVMAGREANLIAAEQAYRRRLITFETDLQSMVVQRGDVVTLSHDLTQWGASGRLLAGTTTVLQLSRPITMTIAITNYIGVRYPNGDYDIYDLVYAAGEVSSVTLATPLPSAPDDDASHRPEDYLFVFEPQATPGKLVKITDIRPLSANKMKISVTDEDPNYYLAEFNAYTYVPPATFGANLPTISNVEVGDTLIRAGSGFGVRVGVVWDVTGEYGGATIRVANYQQPLREMGKTLGRRFEFDWNAEGNIDIEITLANLKGQFGTNSRFTKQYIIQGKTALPDDVAIFNASLQDFSIKLDWEPVADVDVNEYEIRSGADWANSTLLVNVNSTEYLHPMAVAGVYDFVIKAKDTSSNYSLNAFTTQITISSPNQPAVSSRFQGENYVLSWTAAAGSFAVAEYEIRTGANWASGTFVASIKSTSYSERVDFSGTKQFWIAAIDAVGNYSGASNIDIVIGNAPTVTIVAEVIDNNVLLRWDEVSGTLPIKFYEIRRGAVFATATTLQTVNGTFASFFENQSGAYIYWVVAVDSAGNYGTEISIATNVNEPPDYQLNIDWYSVFDGAKTSALIMLNGDLLVPVDIATNYQNHFLNNGYNSPQDQINAGFLHFIQPSVTSAVYEEEFDYEAVLPATLIKAALSTTVITGAISITPTLSTRKLLTDAWDDNVNVWQIFATDFRYVKVRLDFAAAGGDDLLQCHSLNVRLDTKLINDAGSGTANAGDAGGTTVSLNKTFIDVESITVSPNTTSSVTAVYNFTDAPNPTTFKVLLFDSNTGSRVSGDFSWSAKGF